VSCEIGNRQRRREAMNMEIEGPMALEAVTRQPVNKQKTVKTQYELQ
jgi:hypothetical protein